MIKLYNKDCMEALKEMKDNQFDLAIVDPPYGMGNYFFNQMPIPHKQKKGIKSKYKEKEWNVIPTQKYFKELFRVSKNQIIWGGNYFLLPISRGWIYWDKKMGSGGVFSSGELAWTSFAKVLKSYSLCSRDGSNNGKDKIHPTQKPIKLYEWLLMNYAKEGDKILDTHLGSGSIAIACDNLGFDLEGYELDKEYFEAASKRLKQHQSQLRIY